ncbi:MAG: DUF370 domain-containing protein [Firmicutes bacterium]|nr:DUF370 domain-containing protein [Bacillota bacterium]
MYLHVGGDVIIRASDIVAILERNTVVTGAATREFLGFMRARGKVEDLSNGDAKTVVVCRDRVLLSPISASTLKKRIGDLDHLRS